ncbi:MAG: hypothetical protein ACR2PH_10720 [Desulfobulbia bacterium]
MNTKNKEKLLEIIRVSYLAGIDDTEDGGARWCPQGSRERAEELYDEFKDEDTYSGL